MSRGPGKMQRAVLGMLRDSAADDHHYGYARKPYGLRYIAKEIAGRDLDPELLNADHSLIESVRRAIKALERRGIVETGCIWYDTRDPDRKWLAEYQGAGLHVQLTLHEWDTVPCRICTIGPCPRPGLLLLGKRTAKYACPLNFDDPVAKIQAIFNGETKC